MVAAVVAMQVTSLQLVAVVAAAGTAQREGQETAVTGAAWSLRFHRDTINAFGNPGEWLLESGTTGTAASGELQLLHRNDKLVRPLHQPLTCAPDDAEAFQQAVRPYVTNAYQTAAFAPRALPATCGAGARCGRVVVDGIFEEDDLVHLEKAGVQQWGGLHELRELMEETFALPSGRLRAVGGHVDDNVQADIPCQMHVDFQSRPGDYFYSAILYLSDQGSKDTPSKSKGAKGGKKARRSTLLCQTCETVFVDSVDNATGLALRGLAVQPRRGRIALFSGGAENLHCKLPSTGDRRVAQVFFKCGAKDEL